MKFKHSVPTVFCALATVALTSCSVAETILVDRGKSTFTIVVPTKAPDSVTAAAREMQRDIEESTKAKIPIQKDDGKITGSIISLGATNQAKNAGINAQGIADSGFRITTKDGSLYIIGPDTAAKVNFADNRYGNMTPQPDIPGPQSTRDGGWSDGTANGVYTFLEDYLGMRWLMPGELGRDVTVQSSLCIPDINRLEQPEFTFRQITSLEINTYNSTPAVDDWTIRQKLGISTGFRMSSFDHYWWKTVNIAGGERDALVGARINTASVKKLYQEHPEWFAMDVDGKRPFPRDGRGKLESTNQELVKWYAEKAIKAMKENPNLHNTYSLSPSDGAGYSQSPESKAFKELIPPRNTEERPSVGPLVMKWYHDVSAVVAKEYPQGKLGGFIYQYYLDPPTDSFKEYANLPKNFTPMFELNMHGYQLYRKSAREGVERVMREWSNIISPPWFSFVEINTPLIPFMSGIVAPPATGIINFYFHQQSKAGTKGMYIVGNPHWSYAAMTNYINAKMLWNPHLDADELQHEWLLRAYGTRAGTVMEIFYKKLDGWYSEYYNENPDEYGTGLERRFKELYASHYAEMERLLLQAEKQPMTPKQQARFDLFKENVMLLRWRLTNAGYIPPDTNSPLKRDGKQIADLIFDGDNLRKTPDKTLDIFPVKFRYQNQPARIGMNVSLNPAPAKSPEDIPNKGYVLLYPTRDKEITLKGKDIKAGSAMVSYTIYKSKKDNSGFDFVRAGLFYNGVSVTFSAAANTLYLVRIAAQELARPKLNYTLSIPDAGLATGNFTDGTLYLQGKEALVYVCLPKGTGLSEIDGADGVTLSTRFPADAARAVEIQKHPGSKVLLNLDKDWKFKTDPGKTGLQQNVIAPDYSDASWKSVTATGKWQKQEFPDYHGTAWYRKNFNITKHSGKVLLFFGAADGDAVVYVNGQKVGEHLLNAGNGWDEPFALDITKALQPGKNILAVQVTKDTFEGGLYKGVALLDVPE